MIRALTAVALLAVGGAAMGCSLLEPLGDPSEFGSGSPTPTAYRFSTATADRPSSPGEAVAARPGLARRTGAGWERHPLGFVNTAVQREPDWLNSPYKDVWERGSGEPDFHDWRREVIAGGYEPLRWLANLAAVPWSAWRAPYWDWPIDYGPWDPSLPKPPAEPIREPRSVKVDQ